MNKHALIDSFSVNFGSVLFSKSKLFRNSIESPTYEELLNSVTFKWPDIEGEGYYETPAQTAVGELDPAFHIAEWRGNQYPTLIYHHGNNERPFSRRPLGKSSFRDIFLAIKNDIPANLIAVRAPYHRSYKLYIKKIANLANFKALLAVSVHLVEALTNYAARKGSRVVVSGISLGGWVTNLHRIYCNTAGTYLPMLAGTAPDDVFINSVYRKLTGNPVHDNPAAVTKALNFDNLFFKVKDQNLFPLLARYDQVIRFERQMETYKNYPVAVIDKGHITGTMAVKELRKHILPHLIKTPGAL